MSVERIALLERDVSRADLQSVMVASVLGSVAFGIVMSLTMGETMFTAIPAMYGLTEVGPVLGVLVAWGIHVSHGIVLGLIYGGVAITYSKCREELRYGIIAGTAYGILLWIGLGSFLMPLWVGTVSPMNPPVPNWEPWSLIGHVFYGAYVGSFIPLFRRH